MPQAAFSAIVSGRVQMVLYRYSTRQKATELGVTGTVQNLSDGTVSVVAEGEKRSLDALVEYLRRGPLFARVDGVSVQWQEPSGAFRGFSIQY